MTENPISVAQEMANLRLLAAHALNYASDRYTALSPHWELYNTLTQVAKTYHRVVTATQAADKEGAHQAIDDYVTILNTFYLRSGIAQTYVDGYHDDYDPDKWPPEEHMDLLKSLDFNPRQIHPE